MINQRLFDHYGIDTSKDLGIMKRCPRPFDTLLIDKHGSCYACECQAWLPQSVGNLHVQSLSQIHNSLLSQKLRDAIIDGSYRFCNQEQCLYLHDLSRVTWNDKLPEATLREIRLAIDDSCNLSCPSCRRSPVFLKHGKQFKMRISLVDKVIDFLETYQHNLNLHLGSDGDPFASLIYRYFMRNVPVLKQLTYTIQTNGLLVKQMYRRLLPVFNSLKTLNLSIDGASKDTYEKLRLGGRWEKILENLEFIKSIKKEHGFVVNIHMVVQASNWREMPLMLEMAQRFDVDVVYFNPIQNWNVMNDFDVSKIPEHDPEFVNTLLEVKKNPMSNAW